MKIRARFYFVPCYLHTDTSRIEVVGWWRFVYVIMLRIHRLFDALLFTIMRMAGQEYEMHEPLKLYPTSEQIERMR